MEKVRLGDVSTVITKGTTPTSVGYNFVERGINFIKIESITEDGNFIEDKFAYITNECNEKLSRSQLKENDILFSIAGAIGRVAIVDKSILPANTNQALAIIRVPESVYEYNFLKYILRSPAINKQFEKQKQGVAQINLSLKNIGDFEIPVISLEQQREISLVLDKVTDLIDKRKEQLLKLGELVQARFVELFDGTGYPTLKWNEVFNTTTGKLDSNAMVENGEYPFFTCAKEVFRIDKYAFDQEALLLAGNNAAGKYDVKYYKGKFNAYQRTYVLELKEDWSYQLFRYQLEDKLVYLQQQSLGGLTKYLTLKILGELEFVVPPMDKQNEFTAFVEQTDKSKLEVQKSLGKLELLKKALMQKYFG